jgi:uncharacterized protein (DUF4415 family)
LLEILIVGEDLLLLHGISAKLFLKRVSVTVAIEEDLLQQARAVAARSHTSVNEMVRNYLQQVVGRSSASAGRLRRARLVPKCVFPGPGRHRSRYPATNRRLKRIRLHGIRAKLSVMKRVNVTLAIEEDLLQEARAVAARSHTSVNEMVRNYLQQVVGKEQRRLAAFDRIRGLLERPSVTIGGRLPSRAELHER